MTSQSESDQDWKVEPAKHQRGWWAAGYIYRGEAGSHQGQFIPVSHWPTDHEARAFVDAIMAGCSRAEAKERALASRLPGARG